MATNRSEPEIDQLGKFLNVLNSESDRSAALVAAAMLDDRLLEILSAFLIEGAPSRDLLTGFNAPLGTFASRAAAAHSLGLIQENEFREVTLIRKIRNEFGHGWTPITFETESIAKLAKQLPWLGPAEFEKGATLRERFNAAVAMLLVDLMWRTRLVSKERRAEKTWPNKARTK